MCVNLLLKLKFSPLFIKCGVGCGSGCHDNSLVLCLICGLPDDDLVLNPKPLKLPGVTFELSSVSWIEGTVFSPNLSLSSSSSTSLLPSLSSSLSDSSSSSSSSSGGSGSGSLWLDITSSLHHVNRVVC